jgi:hypothetical protein
VPSLQAAIQGEVLSLKNSGPESLEDLRIVVWTRDGTRHVLRAPEPLVSGEGLYLALDSFSPPLSRSIGRDRVEVIATTSSGGRRAETIALR